MAAATQTRQRQSTSKTERLMSKVARFGLAARGCFYLLLAGLVSNLAVQGRHGPQANANGALSTVASNPIGTVAVIAVAAGFAAFGGARLWGAWRDSGQSPWRRAATALQGVFYASLTWIPLSYVLGNDTAGSNKSQHQAAGDLLRLPGGRVIVGVVGLVVIGMCANQIRMALTQEYADGLQLRGSPPWVKSLVHSAARLGIPARALVLGPVGVGLVVAALHSDPSDAEGLDQLLAKLAGQWWGVLLLALVVLGLLVFSTYTFLEARYRKVLRAQ